MRKKTPIALFEEAERLRLRSRFPEALALYEEALERADSKELELGCLLSLADTLRLTGDFKRAYRLYLKASRLSEKLFMEAEYADSLTGCGLSMRALGRWQKALEFFHAALGVYEDTGDLQGIAFTLWAEAGTYRIKGDLKEAMRIFRQAKRLFEKMGDRRGEGYCLTGLGGSLRVSRRYRASLEHYTAANTLFRSLRDTFGIAYSYCGIANALRMKGEFKEALRYFRLATKNYRKIGDRVSYAYTLWGEAMVFIQLGRLDEAEKDLLLSKDLFHKTGDDRGMIYYLIATSQVESSRGRKRRALGLLERAEKKAEAFEFGIERGYVESLISAIKERPERLPLNLP